MPSTPNTQCDGGLFSAILCRTRVTRDFARERREIEEKKEALQRQISLLDADLQRLLLEEEKEKLRRERMAFEEERRRWREDSV